MDNNSGGRERSGVSVFEDVELSAQNIQNAEPIPEFNDDHIENTPDTLTPVEAYNSFQTSANKMRRQQILGEVTDEAAPEKPLYQGEMLSTERRVIEDTDGVDAVTDAKFSKLKTEKDLSKRTGMAGVLAREYKGNKFPDRGYLIDSDDGVVIAHPPKTPPEPASQEPAAPLTNGGES